MIVWGFFSAWGWIGANVIKDKIWPDPPPIVQEKKDDGERNSFSKQKQ